jgi:hypothetical protein
LYKEVIKSSNSKKGGGGDAATKRRKLNKKDKKKKKGPRRERGSDDEGSSSEEEEDDDDDDDDGSSDEDGGTRMEMPREAGSTRANLARGAKSGNNLREQDDDQDEEEMEDDQDAMDAMDEIERDMTPEQAFVATEQARQVEQAKTPEPSDGMDPPRSVPLSLSHPSPSLFHRFTKYSSPLLFVEQVQVVQNSIGRRSETRRFQRLGTVHARIDHGDSQRRFTGR